MLQTEAVMATVHIKGTEAMLYMYLEYPNNIDGEEVLEFTSLNGQTLVHTDAPGQATSAWQWFASAMAGSVRLPETSEVRSSAHASHRGSRCFTAGGHAAGGEAHYAGEMNLTWSWWRHAC